MGRVMRIFRILRRLFMSFIMRILCDRFWLVGWVVNFYKEHLQEFFASEFEFGSRYAKLVRKKIRLSILISLKVLYLT
jgi:beta-lactamase class D